MVRRFTYFSLLVVLISILRAQVENDKPEPKESSIAEGPTIMHAEGGFMFVWNQKDTHFTYHLKGEEVSQVAGSRFFDVGERKIQIRVIPIVEFRPEKKNPTNKEILESHFVWETAWLAETLKEEKLTTGKKSIAIEKQRSALAWHFLMPEKLRAGVAVMKEATDEAVDSEEVASLPYAQCYLTMIDHQNLILLNTHVKEKKGLADSQKFLLAEMKKIQFSEEPVDYKKVQKQLQGTHAKKQDEGDADGGDEKQGDD